MKKDLPGFKLTCICKEKNEKDPAMNTLAHTSTIEVRTHRYGRYEMSLRFKLYHAEFGNVRVKVSGYRERRPLRPRRRRRDD